MLVTDGIRSPVFNTKSASGRGETNKWQAAVFAPADLRLVGVDKDTGMAQWAATAVAGDNFFMCPSNRLFVNQVDRSVGSWLDSLVSKSIAPQMRAGELSRADWHPA